MPILKISLDEQTFNRLAEVSVAELRSLPDQVVVLLRQSLGLAFPFPLAGVADPAGQEDPGCD
jgi:hypothetical protein